MGSSDVGSGATGAHDGVGVHGGVGVNSEVGRLRTVVLHRPGAELQRLTPRNSDRLLFDAIPWVARAQQEHDAFAAVLRDHDVEVLYVTDLLTEALRAGAARVEVIGAAVADPRLGDTLRDRLRGHLEDLDPAALTGALVGGLRFDELDAARPAPSPGLVAVLSAPTDFVLAPLPNLVFTRDSSLWLGDRVAVTSLATAARRPETTLLQAIWTHHPRFAGVGRLFGPGLEHVEGGDVLWLAPDVLAVGTGERTTPAGVERLARQVLGAGVAHTVLAVPIAQGRATIHLDTICTLVDVDAVVMYPNVADALRAYVITAGDGDLRVGPRRPFLEAAAEAMGVDRLRVIATGLDPVVAEREQWDDGNNTLALAPGVVVAYERNTETNARLADAGVTVVPVAGSELGSGRGGPRCLSCPVLRDPLP